MEDRYAPANGLARDIKDDLSDTTSTLEANRKLREGLWLDGNLKLEDSDSFGLDWEMFSVGSYHFTCSGISAIRFNDGTIHSSSAPESINRLVSLSTGSYYVYVQYDWVYTDAGSFVPGMPYPVDSTIGDNTMRYTHLTLNVSTAVPYSPDIVVLYKIYYNGTAISITEDYRTSKGISVPTQSSTITPGSIEQLYLSTIYGHDVGPSQEAAIGLSKTYLTDSSLNKETMLQVEWTQSDNTWFYEIAIAPHVEGSPSTAHTMRHIKYDDGMDIQRMIVPVPNRQTVDVSITPFSPSMARDRGQSITEAGFVVGSDRTSNIAPALSFTTDILDVLPSQTQFIVVSSGMPSQARMSISISGSQGEFEIYRGRICSPILNVPPGSWTPTIKIFGPNGTKLIEETNSPITIESMSTSSKSAEELVVLPINTYINNSNSPAGIRDTCAFLFGPEGGAEIHGAMFNSCGTYAYGSGTMTGLTINFRIREHSAGGASWNDLLEIDEYDDNSWPPRVNSSAGLATVNQPYYYLTPESTKSIRLNEGTLYAIQVECNNISATLELRLVGSLILKMTEPDQSAGVPT